MAEDGSWVVRPTIIDRLALDAAPYCEEIFGPICIANCFVIGDLRTPFGGVGREGGNCNRELVTEPRAAVMQIDRPGGIPHLSKTHLARAEGPGWVWGVTDPGSFSGKPSTGALLGGFWPA